MLSYKNRIRLRSIVFVEWKDNSLAAWTTVNKIDGKEAFIKFLGTGSKTRQVDEIRRITLNRTEELDLFNSDSRRFFSMYMHRKIKFNPFIQQLLQLPMSQEEIATFDGHPWWSKGIAPNNNSYLKQPAFQALNESQQQALIQTDSHRISIVQGPPGTGKTLTIAAEVVRSLSRSSTKSSSENEKGRQRILLVSQTNTAARHMAESIVKAGIGPQQMQLLVAPEFKYDWHDMLYDNLVKGGYMQDAVAAKELKTESPKIESGPDVDVLVCTIGTVIAKMSSPTSVFQYRSTLIIDEASQVWNLHALLLLCRVPTIERLILFGDSAQLAPYVARQEADSVFDAAAKINPDWNPKLHTAGFGIASSTLDTQYRMNPHLGNMISCLFYNGELKTFKKTPDESVEWIDVDGPSPHSGTGCYNPKEAKQAAKLFTSYIKNFNYARSDIVILCFYEAQRSFITKNSPGIEDRVFTVDSYQGQECPIVILTLATCNSNPFIGDRRRVNVACSRAQEKLIIVASKAMVRRSWDKPHSQVWKNILTYAESGTFEDQLAYFPLAAASSSSAASSASSARQAHPYWKDVVMSQHRQTPSQLFGKEVTLTQSIQKHVSSEVHHDLDKDGPFTKLQESYDMKAAASGSENGCQGSGAINVEVANEQEGEAKPQSAGSKAISSLLRCFLPDSDEPGAGCVDIRLRKLDDLFESSSGNRFSQLGLGVSIFKVVDGLLELEILTASDITHQDGARLQLSDKFISGGIQLPERFVSLLKNLEVPPKQSDSSVGIRPNVQESDIRAFVERMVPPGRSVLLSTINDSCLDTYGCSFEELSGKFLADWLKAEAMFCVRVALDSNLNRVSRANSGENMRRAFALLEAMSQSCAV